MKKLSQHVIICGAGSVAQQVYKQLTAGENDVDILFISEKGDELSEILGDDVLRLIADPADNRILQKARLTEARALIAAMEEDSQNVFITLAAKSLNGSIEVSAIAAQEDSGEILRRAGADHIIIPSVIGGREAAMSVLCPSGAEYISELLQTASDAFSIGELPVNEYPYLKGKTLEKLQLHDQDQVIPAAVSREGRLVSNPGNSFHLQTEDVLLVLGKQEDIRNLQEKLLAADRH
ncbi:potassium channel family protein [Sporosarcina koreensis]|uniref:potassium channel family protein n=1 Tax=Sporosarcina koreensis TaxID=334735 RepID=UPI000694274E|nr:TrkA family potassium uptake protein [Sporosarcina koreensis]